MAPQTVEEYLVSELVKDPSKHGLIRGYLEKLEKKDILLLLEKFLDRPAKISIPVSAMSERKLSPLESVVKYLRENLNLCNLSVSKLAGRSPQVCWTTYRNAVRKHPGRLADRHSRYDIPVDTLRDGKRSVLEACAIHLKDSCHASFHEIAVLLGRDDRTIWTAYQRGKRK